MTVLPKNLVFNFLVPDPFEIINFKYSVIKQIVFTFDFKFEPHPQYQKGSKGVRALGHLEGVRGHFQKAVQK